MNNYINKDNFYIGPHSQHLNWESIRRYPEEYKKNREEWFYYPAHGKIPVFPLHVDFETSALCNMNCPMCFRQRKEYDPSKFGLLDYDLFCKGIDECAKHGLYSIRLSWRGECTMHPEFLDMVRYANQKGIKEISFISNGFVIEDGFARELVKVGVDYITVSVDDIGDEYNKIRHPATFEGVVRRLQELRKLRDSIGNGFPRIRINGVWNESKGDVWFENMWNTFGEIVDYITYTPEYAHDNKIKMLKPDFCCQYPFQRLTIMWDGNVPLCISDKERCVSLGNIGSNSLYDIWHSKLINDIRKLHKSYKAEKIDCCSRCDRAVTKQTGNKKT